MINWTLSVEDVARPVDDMKAAVDVDAQGCGDPNKADSDVWASMEDLRHGCAEQAFEFPSGQREETR